MLVEVKTEHGHTSVPIDRIVRISDTAEGSQIHLRSPSGDAASINSKETSFDITKRVNRIHWNRLVGFKGRF